MKKKTKIISIVVLAVLALLVVAANRWRSHSLVRGLRVSIDYQGCDTLVDETDISDLVYDAMGTLESMRVEQVDLARVAGATARSPYLKECEASVSIAGAVVVYAVQRRPIVRLFADEGEYYLDDEGRRMPVSSRGSCNVVVANGAISLKKGDALSVWTLAKYLDSHPEVGVLFDQIYRKPDGCLYLTPKLGRHVVEVGSAERLDEKFGLLTAFYQRGMPRVGWDTYSQVSVKYRDQVVGTRRK